MSEWTAKPGPEQPAYDCSSVGVREGANFDALEDGALGEGDVLEVGAVIEGFGPDGLEAGGEVQ
jgi:hypothetical protein